MPSRPADTASHFLVLVSGLLLLGAGTASISLLGSPSPTLAAAPQAVGGAISILRQPAEPATSVDTSAPAEEASGAAPAEASDGSRDRVDPIPAHVGATDPTILWVAPDGTTGPSVSAIFRVFGGGDGLAWALRVAHCESHYDPAAVNSQSGASGLFQFMPSTWNAYFPGWNIWDPMSQARAALTFYNQGWQYQWECK